MKFSVPTNWDKDLLPVLHSPRIHEVYGKLAEDFIGGGRVSYSLPNVSRSKIAEYIKEVHRLKCEFNYLLNASCLGGNEFTSAGRKQIFKLLDWLAKIGVDSVTVAMPYLAQIIGKNYPHLKIKVSTIAQVDSIEKAEFWQSLGACSITLHYPKLNRNFAALKRIKRSLKCELQLIANNHCLYDCPLALQHANFSSHASQTNSYSGSFNIDYCYLICRYSKLKNPTLFISSPWIRPEDVNRYEQIGIDSIKLVDRRSSTDELKRIITAYLNGKCEGNLIELFPNLSSYTRTGNYNILLRIKHFLRSFSTKRFLTILEIRNLLKKTQVDIDNSSLDGFIDHFFDHDCQTASCAECKYCEQIAERVVKINRDYRERMLKQYEELLDKILLRGML